MLTAPGLNERMDWPPQFGYYFLVLTSQRLLQNIARLEGIIASAPTTTAPAAMTLARARSTSRTYRPSPRRRKRLGL